jgi:GNAT superfamily N-acetyltransferase
MTSAREDWRIDRLSGSVNKFLFSCGVEDLDTFLKNFAKKRMKANSSVTYVVTDELDNVNTVLGYYTICNIGIEYENLPPKTLSSNVPSRYPIPAILLARLAVDEQFQGKGLGKLLLFHCFQQTITVSQISGTCLLIVDAIDCNAKQFYLKHGFRELHSDINRLFITTSALQDL